MADPLPPPAAQFIAALREIGRRAASAAISSTLKGVAEVGSHLTEALTKSAQAADKMAQGQPYKNPFEEEKEEDDDS